jgi:hypothetical protein
LRPGGQSFHGDGNQWLQSAPNNSFGRFDGAASWGFLNLRDGQWTNAIMQRSRRMAAADKTLDFSNKACHSNGIIVQNELSQGGANEKV